MDTVPSKAAESLYERGFVEIDLEDEVAPLQASWHDPDRAMDRLWQALVDEAAARRLRQQEEPMAEEVTETEEAKAPGLQGYMRNNLFELLDDIADSTTRAQVMAWVFEWEIGREEESEDRPAVVVEHRHAEGTRPVRYLVRHSPDGGYEVWDTYEQKAILTTNDRHAARVEADKRAMYIARGPGQVQDRT